MYEVSALDTTQVASSCAQESWAGQVSDIHGRFSFRFGGAQGYRGRLDHQRSSRYQLVRWTGDAEQLCRGPRAIRHDPRDSYELLVPVRGSLNVEQQDLRATITTGEMALVPTDVPLRLEHEAGAASFALLVPHTGIESRLSRGAHGRAHRLSAGTGVGRIAAGLVASIWREREHLDALSYDTICDRLVDLVGLATTAAADVGPGTVSEVVRSYIRAHATDPALSGTSVARATGWSLRHIQAVLAGEGTTPSRLIREHRLDLARLRLGDPALATHSVAAIAHSVGFTSYSAFSSGFRTRFGLSPGDARTTNHHE